MHDDQSSISTAKHIYENVQHASAARHGNALFQSFSSQSNNDGPVRERRQRSDATLRSSINTIDSFVMTPQSSSSQGVSAMGHRLIHMHGPEEELELDREEMGRLVYGRDEDDEEAKVFAGNGFKKLDAHSVGSSSRPSGSDGTKSVSRSAMIYSDESTLTKEERARNRFNDRWSSPACQRALVFLGIALLLATCLVFTFVKMSPKTYDDWVEPNRDAYLNEGIDWAPGPDAPPRFEGAQVDPLIESSIANWALGTLRVSSEATIDGLGSVSMSQLVLSRDVPLFFGTEYTGANMLDLMLGQCLNLIQASNAVDLSDLATENDQISLIWSNGRKYVNVDTTTTIGIDRAYAIGLVTSGVPDVIYSPLLYDASSLFSPKNQARLFMIMRHPVEAQFARFRYLRTTSVMDMPERHDELSKMTYQEFATSEFVDENWMTRALVHKVYGEVLTPTDVGTAKEILRRKAIIGLYDDPERSFKKFARYFNWDQLRTGGSFTDDTNRCFRDVIELAKGKDEILGTLNLKDDDAKEGSEAWKTLMEKNKFDYELYMYSRHLYKYQLGLT